MWHQAERYLGAASCHICWYLNVTRYVGVAGALGPVGCVLAIMMSFHDFMCFVNALNCGVDALNGLHGVVGRWLASRPVPLTWFGIHYTSGISHYKGGKSDAIT